jgi:SulP family sulfate permease
VLTLGRFGVLALTAVAVGAFTVTLSLSVAAIIYQGDLAPFIGRGIALTLLGTVPMAIVGALVLGYRGTICQPQDAPAIVLSVAAAGIAVLPAERAFATTAALVVATSLASGLSAWLLGRLRLGFVARYIPYPVLAGFLAATGYLLVMGGLGIAVGASVEIGHLGLLFTPGNLLRWIPWAAGAVALTALLRRNSNPLTLPLGLFAAGGLFYLVLAVAGVGLAEARADGLLLGPFPSGGFLPSLRGWQPLAVDWLVLARQVPDVLAIVGLTCASALLSASALEVVTGQRIDPDRDLRGIGLCNLAGAVGGASVGYHVLSATLIAERTGSRGRANGLIAAAASLLALVFGAQAIAALPVGLFALLILLIGFSMLIEALFDHRHSLQPSDYAIVLVIPVVTALSGFLWGVAVGILAAALLFVLAFARIDLVRLETTAARMRSRVERSDADQAWLEQHGREAVIYVLAGYVFFGTAHRLVSRIAAALARSPRPRFVVIDCRRVRGIDVSAARAIGLLASACAARKIELILTGVDPAAAGLVRGQRGAEPLRLMPRLEDALEEVEARLIAGAAAGEGAPDLVEELRRRHPGSDVPGYFETVSAADGTEMIAQGAASNFLLVLEEGALRAEVVREGAEPVLVARCLPGALIGEIGLYAAIPRTARVVSEGPSILRRLDREALARMERDDPALLADLHRVIAGRLARRLRRTTALLADSELRAG